MRQTATARTAYIFRHLRRDRPWLGLAAGAMLFVIAAALRWSFGGLTEGFGPMLFLPAVLLAGLLGGIRVGLSMAAICTLIAWTWFFAPYGTFILQPRQQIAMATFLFTAGLELYVIRILNVTINDLSEARERSNTMFRELQHRVANNLQFVAGLLLGQRKGLDKDSVGAMALGAALTRLELMARVHRRLHDPASVDRPIGEYLDELCRDLIRASDVPRTRLIVDMEPLVLDLETLMTLSLIVAEAVTNSLKHAFRQKDDGTILVRFEEKDHRYVLTVADDGSGLPAGLPAARSESLGQGILKSLASQLRGKLTFESCSGTTMRLVFPD
jgi:two-component sensor histidine kinase